VGHLLYALDNVCPPHYTVTTSLIFDAYSITILRGLYCKTIDVGLSIFYEFPNTDSFTAIDVARLLAQVLSNTVTSNDSLVQTLWELYMNLPEEEAVLM